jgi:hypothetical protein
MLLFKGLLDCGSFTQWEVEMMKIMVETVALVAGSLLIGYGTGSFCVALGVLLITLVLDR